MERLSDELLETSLEQTRSKNNVRKHLPPGKVKQLEKSIKEYRQVHSTYITLFGEDDEKTLAIEDIIAGQLFQLQRYEESLEAYQTLLVKQSDAYGDTDAKSLKLRELVILNYIMLGQSQQFHDALQALCELYVNELDYSEEDVVSVRLMFVQYLEKEENYMTAEFLLRDIHNTYAGFYGDESVQCLKIKSRMIDILIKRENIPEALSESVYIANALEENLGALHLDTLDVQRKIAACYIKMKEYDAALNLLIGLFSKYTECYGGECCETLSIRTSIAATLLKKEEFEQAIDIYTAVYESYLNLPDTSKEIITHLKHIIGHIHLKENRLYEAENLFLDVVSEYEDMHKDDPYNPNLVESKASLGAVMLKEKKFDEAREYYLDVLEKYKNLYGEKSKNTLHIEDILMDLNELDSMLTTDDREKISKNVRENEENHFGSENFEKYILPQPQDLVSRTNSIATVQSQKSSQTSVTPESATNTESEADAETSKNYRTKKPKIPNVLIFPEGQKPVEFSSGNNFPELSPLDQNELHRANLMGTKPNSTENSLDIEEIQLRDQPNHSRENQPLRQKEQSWDDVNLNTARDDQAEDGVGENMMESIKRQQREKRLVKKKPKRKNCACCTIS